MNDSEFSRLADMALKQIEIGLDRGETDLDVSTVATGVLEIEFESGNKIIVNRHSAAQEIWVAARSGGFHYRWDGSAWLDTRDQGELMRALSQLISSELGAPFSLD